MAPRKPQHSPHPWTKQQYGFKILWTEDKDKSAELNRSKNKRVQQLVGTLLFYARAVDSALLVALGAISASISPGTVKTMQAVDQVFDYCSMHAGTTIKYRASNIILRIHTDASYQSEKEARRRAGGYFYFGSAHKDDYTSTPNGAIIVESTIL